MVATYCVPRSHTDPAGPASGHRRVQRPLRPVHDVSAAAVPGPAADDRGRLLLQHRPHRRGGRDRRLRPVLEGGRLPDRPRSAPGCSSCRRRCWPCGCPNSPIEILIRDRSTLGARPSSIERSHPSGAVTTAAARARWIATRRYDGYVIRTRSGERVTRGTDVLTRRSAEQAV